MATQTNAEHYIILYSNRTGGQYRINTVKSYKLEGSIDIASDGFEITTGNPSNQASNIVGAGDRIEFYFNGILAAEGLIDDLDLQYNTSSNDIRLTGRDIVGVLIDNDAEPATYNSMGLGDYMNKIIPKYLSQYGIKSYCSDNTKFDKITVSPGESEYSVIERLAAERNLIIIYEINEKTLYCVKPNSNNSPSYIFSNTNPKGIKIKECEITISNDIRKEVIIYGGDYEQNKNIKGSYSDPNVKTNKRKISNETDIENSSDAEKKAKQEFYNINKNALTVKITTNTKFPIFKNKCARVEIDKLGFYATLLIDDVTYTKDMSNGSLTNITLKLMSGVGVSYKNNDIPTLPIL
jgi:prophage tail gpP-like protein